MYYTCYGVILQCTYVLCVSGGFWAVILTRPAQAKCWALVWPCSKHVVADKVVPKQAVWHGPSM